MDHTEDIFTEHNTDDDLPVTRGEMRFIHARIIKKLDTLSNRFTWAVMLSIGGNQLFNHVEIPSTVVGFGGGTVVLIGVLKLFLLK